MKIVIKLFICLLLFCSWSSLQAQLRKPHDPEQVDFYLLTVGLGPDMHMRYGHTFIEMVNKTTGESYNFNWGLFDFDEPNFAWKFFKGVLTYHLGAMSKSSIIRTYEYEQRQVLREKINLTNQQKMQLAEKIFENLKPENRGYSYQHFYNNCATKPRDLLDSVLGGKLKEHFTKIKSEKKFRDYVIENLNSPIFSGFFLSIVMNRLIDLEISVWEEMFYPAKMRQSFLDFPALDDAGKPIENLKLLSDSQVILKGQEFPSSSLNMYLVIYLTGMILMLAIIWIAMTQRKNKILMNIARRVNGLLLIVWGSFSGALGVVMLMSWLFSEHLDILHNANLWFFWPLDFVFLIQGMSLLVLNRSVSLLNKFYYGLFLAHLIGFLLGIILWSVGVIDQDLSKTIFFLFPVAGLLCAYNAKVIKMEFKS